MDLHSRVSNIRRPGAVMRDPKPAHPTKRAATERRGVGERREALAELLPRRPAMLFVLSFTATRVAAAELHELAHSLCARLLGCAPAERPLGARVTTVPGVSARPLARAARFPPPLCCF